ncbi:MAG TPA: aldo/keto reductase [Steroidobacteraceae bacterium]|jgi:aryl-alcohol dehydrogenase-like predicted oxidoreductase|nr:aldo/keto reductase [Steroidobacteraceae bacterium]
MDSSRLALGTAQFGMPYGVANRAGQVGPQEARRILLRARGAGMDTLDTAAAYGTSESALGSIGVSEWSVVSKLPPVPTGCGDVHGWMRTAVAGILARLRIARLGGLLLHTPMQLLEGHGAAIYSSLHQLRADGLAERIGISVYGPDELEALVGRFQFDVVQAPFNILDRRLVSSGWLQRLRSSGVEIHVRSLFLQGLLLMRATERPPEFSRWQRLWDSWHGWLERSGLTAVQACVGFVAGYADVGRAIVGVDSVQQLEEILAAPTLSGVDLPHNLACEERDLVDPSRWRLQGAA